MTRKIIICLVAVLIFQSCEKDHDKFVDETDGLVLEYSPSPIQLDGIDALFAKDISYGPYSENTFDVFMPESEEPTPLVIYIHGGGFLAGEKEKPYAKMWNGNWDFPSEIKILLRQNIAFASINYRLLAFEGDQDGVLKSLSDSKRCLQYIRSVSEVLHIDKNNIVLAGSSAGGGTAEWLAFSDDLADPSNLDPVLRESTRVKGIAVKATQASYNLERYETDIFTDYDFTWKEYFKVDPDMKLRFMSFYGMDTFKDFYSDRVTAYRGKVDMLGMMSADDPEFWVSNPQTPIVKPTKSNILNHHAFQARTLKEWGDRIGIPNVVSYGDYPDPSGESFVDFMIRKTEEQ